MSDSNQTAARLAQVARRLEGAGGGFPEASTSGSGPLADDGLPREPTLVTLVDVGTGRAYHAVTLEDGSIVLELSDELADEAVARAARTGSADAHHPTRFTFRRLVRSGGGGDFFGVAHPASGKYLQAKKQGRHRLMFFSHTCGVNEQFEASDVRDSNPSALFRAGAGSDATIAFARLTPRRFPDAVALQVRLCNALAALPAPNRFEARVLSGAAMPSGVGIAIRDDGSKNAFGSRRSSARSSVSLEATPTTRSAAPSPLPAPPTDRPKVLSEFRVTREASSSRAGSTYATPTVSPNTFAARKSWRVALSLAPESAPSLPPSLPGSAARKGRYANANAGEGSVQSSVHGSVYASVASTPGFGGPYLPLGATPVPGGHVAVGDASQGDALELGVRLMSKFAREMGRGAQRRYLRQVFAVWRRQHERARRHAARVARLASLMRRAIQRRNFGRWAATAAANTEERASSRVARRVLDRRARSRAFYVWKRTHARSRALRVRVRRATARFANRTLATAFQDWASVAEARARDDERAALAAAAAARVEAVQTARRNKAARFAANRAERALRLCHSRWRSAVRERKRHRRIVSRVAARFSRRSLSAAFGGWTAAAAARRRGRKLASRVVQRWSHRSLAWSFREWRHEVNKGKAFESKARAAGKFLRAIISNTKYRAFNRWRARSADAAAGERAARRCVLRMLRRRLASSFFDWRDLTERAAADAARVETAMAEDARLERACERFLRAFGRKTLVSAWNGWRERAAALAARRRKLKKCVARFASRAVWTSFERWAETTESAARSRRIARRAIARLTLGALARTFNAWLEFMSARANRRALSNIARRAAHKLMRNACASAFAHWAELIEAKREAAREAEQAQVLYEAKVKRAERFILRWKQQSIADAFFQWRINVRVCREESARVQLVVSRMLNRRAYAAFNRWLALVEENTRKRQMLAWTVGRISRPSTSAAFEAWRDMVEARKAEVASEQERWLAGVRKAERFILAWAKRDVSTMFIRWRVHTVECKRQRRVVSRCVARMQHRSLASSFNRWTRETAKLQRDRVVVRRALERMRRKSLASAFYEWSDLMADRRRFAEKAVTADRFVMAMRHRGAFRAFNRWRDAARKLRADGVRLARCVQKMTRNACARAFLEWAERVEAKKRAARSISRFVGAMRHRGAFRAFSRWRDAARKLKRDAVKVTRCLQRMRRAAFARAFLDWAELVERLRRDSLEEALEAKTAALESRETEWGATSAVHASFSRWRAAHVQRVSSFAGAQAAFRRVSRTRRRAAAFRRWRGRAVVEKRARHVVSRWRRRVESRAFARWTAFARSSRVARRAAARWASRRVSDAFRAWRLASVSLVARRASEALAAAALMNSTPPRQGAVALPPGSQGLGSRSARSRAALSLVQARVSDADRARVARFAAAAFYERRSRDFLARLVSRWRALVAESRRRVARLGDEMRAVLERRSARRVLDAWNEFAFRSAARRAQASTATRVGRDARTAKALLGWRAAAAEALAARGTPRTSARSRRVGRDDGFAETALRKNDVAPASVASWDWNASVLQNVSNVTSPSLPGSSFSLSETNGGKGRGTGLRDAWHASLSPVPLPSLDLDLGSAASPPPRATSENRSRAFSSLSPSLSEALGGAPRTPADSLRGKRAELASVDARRGRAAPGSPARGALDAAYREVLAECAELEASVEAMGTGAPSRSRLGASARTASSASSAGTGAGTSMDARLVDAGSRAAGMLERAEAMRREMREVSASASRGDDAAPAEASPATETDWNAGLGLARNEAPRADVPEPAAEVSGSASAPPAETNWGAGLGLGRKKQ